MPKHRERKAVCFYYFKNTLTRQGIATAENLVLNERGQYKLIIRSEALEEEKSEHRISCNRTKIHCIPGT